MNMLPMMLAKRFINRQRRWARSKTGLALFAALLTLTPLTSPATSLQLVDSPLFLQTSVQPNIFFMLDDSGSMDAEILLNAGANGPPTGDLILVPTSDVERVEFCAGYNTLAYDPAVTYTPWKGKDKLTNDFQDAHLMEGGGGYNNIRRNPYCPDGDVGANCDDSGNRGVRDLTNPSVLALAYYTWNDANSNGVFDWNDTNSNGVFDDGEGADTECGDVSGPTPKADATLWSELASDAERTNYANWFSYYRKREFIVKRAVSELITDSKARMGLSSIHNNRTIGTQVEDMDDISLPIDPTAQANKEALLGNLVRGRADDVTPLRLGLENVGKYYDGVSQTDLFNGAPAHSTSETETTLSPILNEANGGACQQNFTILLSDGFWNGGPPSVGNTDTDGAGPYDGGAYADDNPNTLADVAMHYYETDLSGLNNLVPPSGGESNPQQHMNTYTVAFGLQGTLPASVTATCPTSAPFAWPTPMGDDPEALDDMFHAACNGRGLYLNASNPQQLADSLDKAIDSIGGKVATAASVATTGGILSTDTRVYQAQFTSGDWSGDLRAVALDIAAGQLGPVDWNAGKELKSLTPSTRQIITWDRTQAPPQGIPFTWAGLPTTPHEDLLNINPSTMTSDGNGQKRLNFLRGDHTEEATGLFRDRKNDFVLGDIVDSAPVFVGVPPFLYPDDLEDATAATKRYSKFRGDQASRTEMIYVGANDGMLHGFDADDGKEKLAYVPFAVFDKLNELTKPDYNHRYYVNGSPTYGDAFFNGGWHSVIVGTLGGGGRGVFALDVTNPASLTEGNADQIALWEFSDADDADLGFTYGTAVIVKTHDAGRWVAIFGNGYNNSGTGTAVLYVLDLATGAVISKIDTGVGTSGTPNGLATPAVIDANGDFVADFVFAGDLQGNMWKFDIRSTTVSDWKNTERVIFTATDDLSSQPQPITVQPEVLNHPTGEGGFMVYFGTGKYIEDGDNATTGTQTQTFYGIWDDGGAAKVDKAKLQTQTISADTASGGQSVRLITNNTINAWGTGAGEHMGWKVDLPDAGEKSVTNPIVLGDRMLFTTLIPLDGPCEFGGTGFLMEINIVNGGSPAAPVFDLDGDGEFDDNDLSTSGGIVAGVNPDVGLLPQPAIFVDTDSGIILKTEAGTKNSDTGAIITNARTGTPFANRRSWRQLQ